MASPTRRVASPGPRSRPSTTTALPGRLLSPQQQRGLVSGHGLRDDRQAAGVSALIRVGCRPADQAISHDLRQSDDLDLTSQGSRTSSNRASASATSGYSRGVPREKKRAPILLPPGAGRAYAMGPVHAVFKADGDETRGRYSISEWWLEPYTRGPGAHTARGRRRLLRDRGDDELLRGRRVDRRTQGLAGDRARQARRTTSRTAPPSERARSTSRCPATSSRTWRGSPSGSARAPQPRPARRTRHPARRSVQAAHPLEKKRAVEHPWRDVHEHALALPTRT